MTAAVRRFACTRCGMCCDRSPEVALSEAAALADVFVFRLMFRFYWLPQKPWDQRQPESANEGAAFYEKRRLFAADARQTLIKMRTDYRHQLGNGPFASIAIRG